MTATGAAPTPSRGSTTTASAASGTARTRSWSPAPTTPSRRRTSTWGNPLWYSASLLISKLHYIWLFLESLDLIMSDYPIARCHFTVVLCFCGRSSSYQFGRTVAAVSAHRPVEHVKNVLEKISGLSGWGTLYLVQLRLGCVDSDFECSPVCPTLLGNLAEAAGQDGGTQKSKST